MKRLNQKYSSSRDLSRSERFLLVAAVEVEEGRARPPQQGQINNCDSRTFVCGFVACVARSGQTSLLLDSIFQLFFRTGSSK